MKIEWKPNNVSFEAIIDGKYCGLVHRNPNHPNVQNPGKWGAVWLTKDGGISSTGMYLETEQEAKEAWIRGYTRESSKDVPSQSQ